MTNARESSSSGGAQPSRGLFAWLTHLFSSITLGIWLLVILFLYSSIGSAGILYPTSWNVFDGDAWQYAQMRQWRPFEMTEFEWFHWWPFDLMMLLIGINIVVATLRRIPLRPVNYGVWGIHAGIIILCIGSWIYFGTKVEGDSPVARRQVVAELPGGARVDFPAVPGARATLAGPDGPVELFVQSVDPQWEIRSGADEGRRAFSVTVAVEGRPKSYMRQVLAGFPDYTEDILRTDDPAQPMQRAVKATGQALVDEELRLSLDYAPQEWVYLANWVQKSWALYLRERGTDRWYQRPVEGLPLYNDYIGSRDEVWLPGDRHIPIDPLDVHVPSYEAGDPLAGTDIVIGSYLRYAELETRNVADDAQFHPIATVVVRGQAGDAARYELDAFDPQGVEGGLLRLVWAETAAELAAMGEQGDPLLTIAVPATGQSLQVPLTAELRNLPEDAFTPIEGTGYSWRVNFWNDGLMIDGQHRVSLASVQVRGPDRAYERWVFEQPELTRDRTLAEAEHVHQEGEADHGAHGGEFLPLDEGLQMTYRPGRRPAPITLVAGPEETDLALVSSTDPQPRPLKVGQRVTLGTGATLEVASFTARSVRETRPAIVPLASRDRDVREEQSMVRVSVPAGGGQRSTWVPYHTYPVRDVGSTLRRYRFRPSTVVLPDGRAIEILFSRQRVALPTPVVLEDFELTTHVGGFSGRTSSIRNWTSMVRFAEGSGWSEPLRVSVNEPVEHGGYWYFQSQWDPPSGPRFQGDPSSQGLNYTVLGVGNRNGVGIQLVGCCIAVAGMLYAFYVKPLLRRRHQAGAAASAPRARAVVPPPVALAEGERA